VHTMSIFACQLILIELRLNHLKMQIFFR